MAQQSARQIALRQRNLGKSRRRRGHSGASFAAGSRLPPTALAQLREAPLDEMAGNLQRVTDAAHPFGTLDAVLHFEYEAEQRLQCLCLALGTPQVAALCGPGHQKAERRQRSP